MLPQLEELMPECLESAEYYALVGAAQLNTGMISTALESLERALLLDPDNGGAQVDYSQALYIAGQLFPALQMNQALLEREDIPVSLQSMLQQRQEAWQSQTRNKGLTAEVAAGYDNNLNGAPSRSSFTLTLSGEPVSVPLSPQYQPVSGPYINMRLTGFYQKLAPEKTHDLIFALRSRQSEHSESELLQFDWRYALSLPLRRYQWELTAGTSHLLYGGSPLYTVTEARARLRMRGEGCQPHYELAAQHQLYHGQSIMTGAEASATGGFDCSLGEGSQLFGVDAGLLSNTALKDSRPGGNREGWTVRLTWQLGLGEGTLNSQFSYANLDDQEGYSDLLDNGAKRQVSNRLFRLQYSRILQPDLTLLVNFNHQGQGSNIGPFQNKGTAIEVGLGLNL